MTHYITTSCINTRCSEGHNTVRAKQESLHYRITHGLTPMEAEMGDFRF